MARRKVFVIWANPIVHDSIRLLLNHPEVEWVGSVSNFTDARDDILRLDPDTILVEKTDAGISTMIMEILELSPSGGRVVAMNLNNNQLCVYHREERTIAKANDLLGVVLSDS
jgi:hypothetical protein